MEITRKTDILVKTRRRFTVSRADFPDRIECRECSELMLKAEQAARLFGISCRELYRLIEVGAADYIETENGASFVCTTSLADYFDEQEKNEL